MLVKRLHDCSEFEANDGCQVRELLHPKNDPVSLPFSLAICTVAPGAKTYVHRLAQAEVYYISADSDGRTSDTRSPRWVQVTLYKSPRGESQWFENLGDGDLVFAAIVSPPWCAEDDIRL